MIEIWIGRAGKRSGPYPREKVLAAHQQGKLHGSDLLWWQGLAQWEPVTTAIGKLQAVDGTPPVASATPATSASSAADADADADAGLQLEPMPAERVAAAPSAPAAAASEDLGGGPAAARPARSTVPDHAPVAESDDEDLANAPYAGFWRRFAAVGIDSILVGILQAVIAAVLVRPFGAHRVDATILVVQLIALVAAWGYTAGFESSRWRATPGKRLLGLRVARAGTYERISLARATGRFFARFLSWFILSIGYLMQPFNEQRQTLHDKLTDVVVVKV